LQRIGLIILAASLALATLTVEAQQTAKVYRIGVLALGVASSTPLAEAFRQGLKEHGYVEGQNIALEYRYAGGEAGRLPALAADLVRLKVDVIVAESNAATLAAKHATRIIPIVMVAGDPIKTGVVGSLARPDSNVTGLTMMHPELSGKRLQLLKEAAPKIALIAVIWNPTDPFSEDLLRETEAAARSLGLKIHAIEAREPAELEAAFKAVVDSRPSAFFTIPGSMFLDNRTRILKFATKSRLPGVFGTRGYAEAGGLMSYGPSLADLFRKAAVFVDKILKGAKPADLPIEQPTKFELVINLKTAKALGLTIPPSVLGRADQVIQ
jgi:putative tryptophan/tyrosine transport system substrate-binding protein